VKEQMGSDVRNGDVFIFIGSSRRLMKLLHAEDGGMVMYVKRLEAGRFRIPEYDESTRSYPMEWRDLVVILITTKTEVTNLYLPIQTKLQ
ncbi:MAG: IS66 family insertion sequence element accessory protein TnpB, partial [Muribaculaceae bacterium]|nr:IS66 family insertion sequence element accessory protein TnpB [Muribaculaceae bacterium]